ncbi:MAG: hypothetical protein ACREQ5_03595 [Candidatus Dormibacteria bacterium]
MDPTLLGALLGIGAGTVSAAVTVGVHLYAKVVALDAKVNTLIEVVGKDRS